MRWFSHLRMMTVELIFQTQGTTRTRLEELRSDIIHCLSMVEALIDFGEGEEIEEGVYNQGSS